MSRSKPETLALVVAMAGTVTVLVVFLTDLILTRHYDLEAGERRLQHFGIMMAEHTARTFEAVDVLLRETASDLTYSRRNWENWSPTHGWEYIAQRHSRAMPQLRDLIIFDRSGKQRFISSYFPAPDINVRDRPYFIELAGGAEQSTYGPYIGRNSGRYLYGIARRVANEQGQFAGAVFGAIEPAYLQDFCWSNRLGDDFESVLINSRGEIAASCRPTDLSRQSPVLGAQASRLLFNGKLEGPLTENGLTRRNGFLISIAPVPGFGDLRILSVVPERSLLTAWYSRLFELGTLGALVAIVLVIGAVMIRRQVREMSRMTDELEASHEHLEERIRAATQELAGERDAAERASTAKSRFLAAASHDLRQPLHALSLFAADLQRQVQSGMPRDLPRLSEQISLSTSQLGELLNSLLDLSRLDVAGIKPETRHFALQSSFNRLAESFQRTADDHQTILRFRPTRYWVETDQVMLEQMLANLISNALRYTPAGGRVLIAARRRGERIQIEVRDNGIGIAAEHQAAIFAEFYQVGNAAREQNLGLGLGLSIVDRLARALGIAVALRSRVGEGTVFSLGAPIGQPAMRRSLSADAAPRVSRVHCFGNSEDIRICRELLERWGYPVSAEENIGSQAPPRRGVLIADDRLAETINEARSADSVLVVLVHDPARSLPPGVHPLPTPLRPAKLRALLGQLQKTLSKSMP